VLTAMRANMRNERIPSSDRWHKHESEGWIGKAGMRG
jgi:hypothetical protein